MKRSWLALAVLLWSAVAIPVFAEPVPVGGRIVDPDGRPVRGATVELIPMVERFARQEMRLQGKAYPEPVVRASGREDGRFEVAAPAPGMWLVRVSARGFVPRLYALTPLIEAAELPLLEMIRDAPLRVRVLDRQGKPVAGARVRSSSAGGGASGWSTPLDLVLTTADGAVQVPRGKQVRLDVQVLAPGYPAASLRVEPSDSTAEIRLAPGCSRSLRVTVQEKEGEAPRPVAGALVTADGWALGSTDEAGGLAVSAPCDADLRAEVETRDGRRAEVTLRRGPAPPAGTAPVAVRLPAQPARMAGRVIEDGSRKPLAGALVWPGDDPAAFVTTDAKGAYTIHAPVDSRPRVEGAAVGYLRASEAAPAAAGPTLALKPLATVSGKVIDEAGRPVPDAVLRATADSEPRRSPGASASAVPPARSGAQGQFQLRVTPGQASTLTVSHPGFTSAKLPLPALAAREPRTGLEVVLKRGLTAFGKVVDGAGQPVAGAEVSLFAEVEGDNPFVFDLVSREPAPPAVSGAQGDFVLEHLEPGRFELQASGRGFAPTLVPGIQLAEGQGRVDLGTVTLGPGVTLEGVVVDPRDSPVAGAEVSARDFERFFRRGIRPPELDPVLTAADGSFSIPDLRPGDSLMVFVHKKGYAGADLNSIKVPTAEPLRVVLKPGSTITGRVVNEDGDPVSGAVVELSPIGTQLAGLRFSRIPPERTEPDGRFTFEGIQPGKVRLITVARGYLEDELPDLEVAAGKNVEGLEVTLERGAVVLGRVLGADGAPVPGASLKIVQEESSPANYLGGVTSDGDGNYRLEGVATGARSVSAEGKGFQRTVKDLEVRPGENRLDFRLEAGHDVAGRVVDAGGAPVAGATVRLLPPGQSGPYFLNRGAPEAKSGADGSFRLTAVSTGAYDLRADKEGYATGRLDAVNVSAPLLGLEIRLEAGGVIRGQLTGVEFSDLPGVNVVAMTVETGDARRGRVDHQGQYRLEGLTPGEWRVVAQTNDGRRADGTATVTQGAEAVLDLEIGAGYTLSGRVVRAGEPVTNVMVLVSAAGMGGGNDQTDPQGAFRIAGLKAGSYEVNVVGFESGVNQHQTVEISGDREIVIEITTRQVSGRVIDATDESPLAKVELTLERVVDPGAPPGRTLLGLEKGTTSDRDGAFTIADVAPGPYRLLARLDGYAGSETPVQVGSAADIDNLRVALQPTEGLTLQVSRSVGVPPSEVRVALLDSAGRSLLTNSYPTGENGRVRIPSAPPGQWRLLVSADGSATVAQPIQVPGPPVRVVLPLTSSLLVSAPGVTGEASATVIGSDGQPFRGLGFGAIIEKWPLFEGTGRIDGLPPGAWRVRITSPGGQTREAPVTVSPGGTSRVTVP